MSKHDKIHIDPTSCEGDYFIGHSTDNSLIVNGYFVPESDYQQMKEKADKWDAQQRMFDGRNDSKFSLDDLRELYE